MDAWRARGRDGCCASARLPTPDDITPGACGDFCNCFCSALIPRVPPPCRYSAHIMVVVTVSYVLIVRDDVSNVHRQVSAGRRANRSLRPGLSRHFDTLPCITTAFRRLPGPAVLTHKFLRNQKWRLQRGVCSSRSEQNLSAIKVSR